MSHFSTAAFLEPKAATSWRSLACTVAVVAGLLLNFLVAERHDDQRCIELAVLLLAAVAVALRGRGAALAATGTKVQLPLLGFFSLGLASALSAWSLRHALYEWSSMLLLAVLAFAVATEIVRSGAEGLQRILQCAGAACLLYSLRVLLTYAPAVAGGYQLDMHELAVGFSNARFLNHTQTALLPLIVLLCLRERPGTALRRTWFVLASFWWALLYLSEARATWLALAAGCTVAFLARRRHAHGFLKTMGLTALGGCLVYGLLFMLLPMLGGLHAFGSMANVVARTASDPASGRMLLWHRALDLIAQHPWLGTGPQHFSHYGADLQVGAHPHDWILQVTSEWGVPALLCVLCVAGLGMRALLKSGARIAPADGRNQQLLVTFTVAVTAILVDGLFSGVFVMPQSRLAIALVVGCAIGWVRSLEGQAPAQAAPAMVRRGVALAAVAGACMLAWAVAPTLAAHAAHAPLSRAEQAANPGVRWPRIWEAGYF